MKIRLLVETVEVHAESWAREYDIPIKDVREDVKATYADSHQAHIDNLGLSSKMVTEQNEQ